MNTRIALFFSAFALCFSLAQAGSFADRKNQRLADSATPVAVKGAPSFTIPTAYDVAFDTIVRTLKKADESIALADRETGMIATEITVTGGYRQTGTRTIVTLIKESDSETTVKVAATKQTRYKALSIEPWSAPKLDDAATPGALERLQAAFKAK